LPGKEERGKERKKKSLPTAPKVYIGRTSSHSVWQGRGEKTARALPSRMEGRRGVMGTPKREDQAKGHHLASNDD